MTAYDTANQAMQDTLNAIEASETAAEATIRELRAKLAEAEKAREAAFRAGYSAGWDDSFYWTEQSPKYQAHEDDAWAAYRAGGGDV